VTVVTVELQRFVMHRCGHSVLMMHGAVTQNPELGLGIGPEKGKQQREGYQLFHSYLCPDD